MQVSVIIPVYNAERFVAEAVESALDQPETGEVLLIEDASPDGSLAVCERLAAEHERVKLLRHPGGENRGAGESRNVGIRAAQFSYIAFLDADDWYLPGRFTPVVNILSSDESVDGVYDAVATECQSEAAAAWWRDHYGGLVTAVQDEVSAEDLFEALLSGDRGWFCTDGIVARRSLFERCGLFESTLRMSQDSQMWQRMSLVGRLVPSGAGRPMAARRVHGENRIIRHRAAHAAYRRASIETLWRWTRRRSMRARQRAVLLDALLRMRSQSGAKAGLRYVARKMRDVLFLSAVAARWPELLREPHYLALWGRTFPVRRILARDRKSAAGRGEASVQGKPVSRGQADG